MTTRKKEEISRRIREGTWVHVTGSRKNICQTEFFPLVSDLLASEPVQALGEYRHHIRTTRYQHCLNVAYYNYRVCRLLRLDAASAARAGLLHDLYHYETSGFSRRKPPLKHSEYHPMAALEAAEKLVPMNERERDIIEKHMWPVTRPRPKFVESYVITFVDKYCAMLEFLLPQPDIFRQRPHR